MPREGYTNLSIESKRYDKNRRSFDMHVKQDLTYSAWAMDTLDAAIEREILLTKLFPKLHFIGKKQDGGIVVEDNKMLIEIQIKAGSFVCSNDKGLCNHILFATMHPLFV